MNVCETPILRPGFDPFFFRAFSNQKKHYFRILPLQLGRGVQQGFEPMRHAHGARVADQKLPFGAKLLAQRTIAAGGCGAKDRPRRRFQRRRFFPQARASVRSNVV